MTDPTRLPGFRRQPRYESIVRVAPMRFGLTVRGADGGRVVHELGRRLPPFQIRRLHADGAE